MKSLILASLVLLSFGARAQQSPGFLATVHTTVNELLARAIDGDCTKMASSAKCEACREHTAAPTPARSLDEVASTVSKVGLNEDVFFENAAAAQASYLACYQRQLASMAGDDPQATEYQVMVLTDLREKLPALREYNRIVTACKGRIDEFKKQIEGVWRGVARSFYTEAQASSMVAAIGKQIEAERVTCDPRSAEYDLLFGSIALSSNPHMNNFIHRAISSDKTPESIFNDGMQVTSQDGVFRRLVGASSLSFRDEVLRPMLEDSRTDFAALKSRPLSNKTKAGLVTESDWADTFKAASREGVTTAAVLMCQLDQKYVTGKTYTDNAVMAASFFVGGEALASVGYAVKLARLGAAGLEAEAAAVQASRLYRAVRASRGLALATSYLLITPAIESAVANCFQDNLGASYNERSCDEESVRNFGAQERKRFVQESCVTSAIFAGLAALPVARQAIEKSLRALRPLFPVEAVAGSPKLSSIVERIHRVRADAPEEIVVTGTKPPKVKVPAYVAPEASDEARRAYDALAAARKAVPRNEGLILERERAYAAFEGTSGWEQGLREAMSSGRMSVSQLLQHYFPQVAGGPLTREISHKDFQSTAGRILYYLGYPPSANSSRLMAEAMVEFEKVRAANPSIPSSVMNTLRQLVAANEQTASSWRMWEVLKGLSPGIRDRKQTLFQQLLALQRTPEGSAEERAAREAYLSLESSMIGELRLRRPMAASELMRDGTIQPREVVDVLFPELGGRGSFSGYEVLTRFSQREKLQALVDLRNLLRVAGRPDEEFVEALHGIPDSVIPGYPWNKLTPDRAEEFYQQIRTELRALE